MECAALQRNQSLAHQLFSAVDEACQLGTIFLRSVRNSGEVRFVGLAEICGVATGTGTALAHPGDSGRRVESARKSDADALASGKFSEDL